MIGHSEGGMLTFTSEQLREELGPEAKNVDVLTSKRWVSACARRVRMRSGRRLRIGGSAVW